MSDNLIDLKNKQINIDAINIFQNQIFDLDEILNEISFLNQENIRYQQITNDDQANNYIQDLNLTDLNDIKDPQAKAYHLYGFFDYLNKSHQLEGYTKNLIKLFQLAIYYDDNYVYRYYLAFFYQQLGFKKEAIQNLKISLEQLKNKDKKIFQELLQQPELSLIKEKILHLTKEISLN